MRFGGKGGKQQGRGEEERRKAKQDRKKGCRLGGDEGKKGSKVFE